MNADAAAESDLCTGHQQIYSDATMPEFLLFCGLSTGQLALCIYLQSSSRGNSTTWPTNGSLAQISSMGEQHIGRNLIPSLVRAGLVCRFPAPRNDEGQTLGRIARGHLLLLMWHPDAKDYLSTYDPQEVLSLNPELNRMSLHRLLIQNLEDSILVVRPRKRRSPGNSLKILKLQAGGVAGYTPPPSGGLGGGCQNTDNSKSPSISGSGRRGGLGGGCQNTDNSKSPSISGSGRRGVLGGGCQNTDNSSDKNLNLKIKKERSDQIRSGNETERIVFFPGEDRTQARPETLAPPLAQVSVPAGPEPVMEGPSSTALPANQELTIEQAIERLPKERGLVGTVVNWLVDDLNDHNARSWHTKCANQVARGEAPPARLLDAYRAGLSVAQINPRKAGPTFSSAWKSWRPRVASGKARPGSSAARAQQGSGQTSSWSGQSGFLNDQLRAAGVGPTSAPVPQTSPEEEETPEERAKLWEEFRVKINRDLAESRRGGRLFGNYYTQKQKTAECADPATDQAPAVDAPPEPKLKTA